MFDITDESIFEKLENWAQINDEVKAVILTGSKVSIHSKPDKLSDYDVEIFVTDLDNFKEDKWLQTFGPILSLWPMHPEYTGFKKNSITRLVVFKDYSRIDFQIMPLNDFDATEYDDGFKVLVDKIGINELLPKPTYTVNIVKKPTEKEFLDAINGFYWDIPYIAKALRRGEISFARYMLLGAIRYESFERMLAWYVSSQNGWETNYGVHGRNIEKHTNQDLASRINNLCADENPKNIWDATVQMKDLFDEFTKTIADELGYTAKHTDTVAIIKYCESILSAPLD